jgi:hypothetical protein
LRADADEPTQTAVVEAYGARLAVSAPDADALRAILDGLPRGWAVSGEDVPHEAIEWRFAVLRNGDGYRTRDNHGQERECSDLELATWMLRTQMRRFVGYHSPDLIFVHAGVVAHSGRAILLPGHSFAGKSTLVEALVRARADFYSDEYAMLDKEGRVAHYLEPLSVRGSQGQEEIELGSTAVQQPAPVGLVAMTVYKPGSSWSPRRLTAGEGVVAMMQHAVPARDRPAETLAALRLALADAEILQGERGEADETARALLDAVSAMRG